MAFCGVRAVGFDRRIQGRNETDTGLEEPLVQ